MYLCVYVYIEAVKITRVRDIELWLLGAARQGLRVCVCACVRVCECYVSLSYIHTYICTHTHAEERIRPPLNKKHSYVSLSYMHTYIRTYLHTYAHTHMQKRG